MSDMNLWSGRRAGQPRWFQALAMLALLCAAALPGSARAGGIPEPDTVFFGQVLSYDRGHDVLISAGELVWRIQPDGDTSKALVLRATLEPLTNGATVFSYRLKVPQEALASGLVLGDLSAETLALQTSDKRYRHAEIRVNGEVARIRPAGSPVFDVAQKRRASAYRLDLEVSLPQADTDGQGLPDWWQRRYFGALGVDPNADPDGDGLSNRAEYQAGTDPTTGNRSPTISWTNAELDEGTTEVVALETVDSDTPSTNLVYTLVEAPRGAFFTLLFGATVAGPTGRFVDRVLRDGDTFTQAQVEAGRLLITHSDPRTNAVSFRLRLTDGDTNHVPYETTLTMKVHEPTAVDGTGAAVWLSSRFETNKSLGVWPDQSGVKPWLNGTEAPFNAAAAPQPVVVTNRGPRGQSVLAMNLPGQAGVQRLMLPDPALAEVFHPGEITVFAVFNSAGSGEVMEQIVNGPHFQLAVTGADDHGRDSQVRFASESAGVVYSNRKVKDQWVLVSAWQEADTLAVELNGTEVGGPHPLNPPTSFGTDPVIGARAEGTIVDQPFQGWIGEVLVFNRNLDDSERHRINYSLMSKWFGWVLLDGSVEPRDLKWRVPSSGISTQEYLTSFIPKYGPDRNYIILGGLGHDVLQGGQADDIIVGGRQSDTMSGGGGRDQFVFNFAHIHQGADTITDFNPRGERDGINLADLLRGESRDLRDYLHLRTDGHNSYLEIDFLGLRRYTNHTIVLQSTVLRDDDLPELWARGNLITGDKRVPLAVSLATVSPVATEITGTPAVFNVHFEGASVPEDLEIPFELGGSAVRGVNYRLSLQRYDETTGGYLWEPVNDHELFVKLKPGDFDFQVRVEPIADTRSQAPRTVTFRLTAVPELFDVSGAPATAQIIDGPARVSVGATDNRASEAGDPAMFTLRREGSLDVPLDVRVLLTGPAENGRDYGYIPTVIHFEIGQSVVEVLLTPYPDEIRELAEAAEMVLQPDPNYLINPSAQSATVMIANADAVITVEAIQPLAVIQDASPGAFLIRRQGVISDSIVVLLDLGGNATPGRDYRRINNFVSFAPGVTTVLISVDPLAGGQVTGTAETVNLTVRTDPSYSLGRAASAQVRLVAATMDFAQWKAVKFPGNTVPVAEFANLDSDGDHLLNAVEYGFGFDPTVANPNPPGLPRPVVVTGHLGVTFTRPIMAVDLDYLIEVSSDLVNWELADDFQEQPGVLGANGIETVTFLDPLPTTYSNHRYVRVSVVMY